MHIPSRLKEVNMEDIPNVTSDIIERLKKLNINSVYQLAVQSPIELALEFEDTSLNVESASKLIANARKILIDTEVLSQEFLTADDLLEKRNKLTRYAIGSHSFWDLIRSPSIGGMRYFNNVKEILNQQKQNFKTGLYE
jgi:hypothetical protein